MNIPDKARDAAFRAYLTTDSIFDALEAAAPFIAAQALRDAAEQMRGETISALECWADEMDPQ